MMVVLDGQLLDSVATTRSTWHETVALHVSAKESGFHTVHFGPTLIVWANVWLANFTTLDSPTTTPTRRRARRSDSRLAEGRADDRGCLAAGLAAVCTWIQRVLFRFNSFARPFLATAFRRWNTAFPCGSELAFPSCVHLLKGRAHAGAGRPCLYSTFPPPFPLSSLGLPTDYRGAAGDRAARLRWSSPYMELCCRRSISKRFQGSEVCEGLRGFARVCSRGQLYYTGHPYDYTNEAASAAFGLTSG